MLRRRISTEYLKYSRFAKRSFIVGVFILLFVSLSLIFARSELVEDEHAGSYFSNVAIQATPSVVASSSAQLIPPKPSPSPIPVYSGFCLNVPVIFYHHIQPLAEAKAQGHQSLTVDSGIFDAQMAYLVSHGYTTISAEQLVAALAGHSGVPAKSIVVSMDDGYDDIFKYAYPIIQKYGIVASLAISTGLLNNPGYMNWDQLRQMGGSGKVFFYNHTWSHANLAGATKNKAEYEVSTAKKQLAENLGSNSSVLFYPYGASNDMVTQVLARNGYIAAFTTLPGTLQCSGFMMSLHRTRIGNLPLASYGL